MKLYDLKNNETMLSDFKKDIKKIEEEKDSFFMNRLSGKLNQKELDKFNQVKEWDLLYALRDNCLYAFELVIILQSIGKYALIHYYNAGDSIKTSMNVKMCENKQEINNFFDKVFSFNGLDSITDKRLEPRFDFKTLVHSL